jgi:NAD(P)-dependent dehydrogenase (short-subunit alcohol dehydrogenase family)
MAGKGRLSGKTALITGGGSGIGRETARLLAAEGCRVAVAGRTEARLRETCDQVPGEPRPVFRLCDVSDPSQVKALIDWATKELGDIDILVNNAGLNIKKRGVRELTPESWQQIIRTNLDGAFYCIHYLLPRMLERRDGLIINISSTAGKRATPLGGAAYAASKFGLSALSLCLGMEEKDAGIRCCAIYPGEVDTPILEERPTPVTPEHRRQILKPEDVAEAVLFVATLPPHVSVPELIIKPTVQAYI